MTIIFRRKNMFWVIIEDRQHLNWCNGSVVPKMVGDNRPWGQRKWDKEQVIRFWE